MPGSHRGRYHTDRQPAVAGLVYVLAIVVAASVGATARAGRFWGLGPASYGGGAAGIRTRPAPRSAPLPHGAGPRSTERRGPLTRSPSHWAAIGSRPCGCTFTAWPRGVSRPSSASAGTLADPARDCGRTRGPDKGATRVPGSHGALTLRPSTLAIRALYPRFTWVQIAGPAQAERSPRSGARLVPRPVPHPAGSTGKPAAPLASPICI